MTLWQLTYHPGLEKWWEKCFCLFWGQAPAVFRDGSCSVAWISGFPTIALCLSSLSPSRGRGPLPSTAAQGGRLLVQAWPCSTLCPSSETLHGTSSTLLLPPVVSFLADFWEVNLQNAPDTPRHAGERENLNYPLKPMDTMRSVNWVIC